MRDNFVEQSALVAVLNTCFKLGDALRTNCVNDAPKLLNTRSEPRQFFLANAVMFRIACLHICFLELLEPRPVGTKFARPAIDKAHIKTLSLGSQKAKIVHMWRVK